MRKKHSETSSPLLKRNPLSRTHLLDCESSKAVDVNGKTADESVVETDETSKHDGQFNHFNHFNHSTISENKIFGVEEGSYCSKVADNKETNEYTESGSSDKKRKRGRPRKNLEVNPNSRSAEVSEKRGKGRTKGKTKVKHEVPEYENVEIGEMRGTPYRAATQTNNILEFHRGSESGSDYIPKSDLDSSIEKKRRGRPKKNSQATAIKKRDSRRRIRKSTSKFVEESDISTDSNSLSSESELERELQRESEKDSDNDSEIELEIQLQRLPTTNSSAEGGSIRGRGRPKGRKNRVRQISEEFYEVEKILGEKIESGCHYFLVKWKNWPEYANSWELAANVTCDELIENFRLLCQSMHSSKRTADSSSTETPIIVKKPKTNDESDDKEIDFLSNQL